MGPAAGAYLAVAAIVTAVAGAVASSDQSRRATHATQDAARAQQNLARVENIRQKQEQFRRERAARADIIAGGEAVGASESSGVTGGVSGVESTAAGNVSFLNTAQAATDYITEKNIFASQRQANATNIGVFSEVASNAFAIGSRYAVPKTTPTPSGPGFNELPQ